MMLPEDEKKKAAVIQRYMNNAREVISQVSGGYRSIGYVSGAEARQALWALKELIDSMEMDLLFYESGVGELRNFERHLQSIRDFQSREVLSALSAKLQDQTYILKFEANTEDVLKLFDGATTENASESLSRQDPAFTNFEFANGHLHIKPTLFEGEARDAVNTEAARQSIISRGQLLLDQLASSNAAVLVCPSLSILVDRLVDNAGVVSYGYAAKELDLVIAHTKEQLLPHHCAILQVYAEGIWDFINQFSDWHRFKDQSKRFSYSESQAKATTKSANDLVSALTENGLAAPKVPEAFAYLSRLAAEAVNQPDKAAKRAIYALGRTVENALKALIDGFKELVKATINKTAEHTSTVIAGLVAVTILGSAISFGNAWVSGSGSSWVTQQISNLLPVLEKYADKVKNPSD